MMVIPFWRPAIFVFVFVYILSLFICGNKLSLSLSLQEIIGGIAHAHSQWLVIAPEFLKKNQAQRYKNINVQTFYMVAIYANKTC